MGKVMRHTLGASLNIRHNLSSSKGPKPLQLKLLTTYIPKTSAFTLAFSTSQRLRTTRASARTFFTVRHYITPSARNFLRTFSSSSVISSVFPARTRKLTVFPYTTLFRSRLNCTVELVVVVAVAVAVVAPALGSGRAGRIDRKSTRLNSSHTVISYAVFCLKKKKKQ